MIEAWTLGQQWTAVDSNADGSIDASCLHGSMYPHLPERNAAKPRYGHPSDPSRRIDVTERVKAFMNGHENLGSGNLDISIQNCPSDCPTVLLTVLLTTAWRSFVLDKLRLGGLLRQNCYRISKYLVRGAVDRTLNTKALRILSLPLQSRLSR